MDVRFGIKDLVRPVMELFMLLYAMDIKTLIISILIGVGAVVMMAIFIWEI